MTKRDKRDEEKLLAFVATFLSIVGFVIALIAKRDNKYVMFYAKQSLIVFIAGAVAGVLANIFDSLPIIGPIIVAALTISIVLLWILSWSYAMSGKMNEVPIIGNLGKKFKF